MPITPLHFGINGTIGLLFHKKIDWISCVLANIVIDIQPFLVVFFDVDIPLHGFSHTLLGGTIIVVPFFVVYGIIMNNLFIKKSILKYVFGGWIGMVLHIMLDSINHTDVQIFVPFSDINFATDMTERLVFPIWVIGYIVFILLYLVGKKRHNKCFKWTKLKLCHLSKC